MKNNIFKTFIFSFFLTTSYALSAQDPQTPAFKDFKIMIERTPKGLQLKSLKGSAWINLGFTLKNDNAQAIDEYGMATLGSVNTTKNPDYTDYLFTITKRKNEIVLKGIEGTAWKQLSFILPDGGKQIIGPYGLADN